MKLKRYIIHNTVSSQMVAAYGICYIITAYSSEYLHFGK